MNIFNKSILEEIGKILINRKQTVAVAESVTAGLMQFSFGNIENASQFYQGGITAYNIGQKYKHLLVEPIHALNVNCVSENVSTQMAIEVNRLFNSHWGLSITGYASPVPESGNELFAFYGIAFKQEILKSEKLFTMEADPFKVQASYVNVILESFVNLLKEKTLF